MPDVLQMIGRANRPLTDQEGKEVFYFTCLIEILKNIRKVLKMMVTKHAYMTRDLQENVSHYV